jgi:hypothetical protein
MNEVQRLNIRRRLERAHKEVVIDLCLRLMESNDALTRRLASRYLRRRAGPCAPQENAVERSGV